MTARTGRCFCALLSVAAAGSGCRTPSSSDKAPSDSQSLLPMPPGLEESYLDPKINPCDDFYQFACGGWLQRTQIPAERSGWSFFDVVAERNIAILRALLDSAASGVPLEGTEYSRQLGDFYASCTDEPKLEEGLTEFRAELAKFTVVRDAKSLTRRIAELHARGIPALFQFQSGQDFKDSTHVIGIFYQDGIGLPDRDYYLSDDARMKEIRAQYLDHMRKMFVLLGEQPAQAQRDADSVMALETALAKASLSAVDLRDPQKIYHRLDRAGLAKSAPKFLWDDYFEIIGIPKVEAINVTHVPFAEELNHLVGTTPASTWKVYLTWHFLKDVVPALPKRFQEEDFRFEGKILNGAEEDKPRWKKCVAMTDAGLGEALAQPFVAKTFGTEGKATTQRMVAEIEAAFNRDLDTLTWMDEPTRLKAREKLRAIVNKVGFPDRWKSYDGLKIDRGSFLGNYLRADAYERARDLKKIDQPLDRSEWLMTPPTVNAYYYPPRNEIVFPAGILQPPFFNRAAPDAVNLGAMGMVVGHETTHGFDDEGRHFDAQGNLKEWWTSASDEAFRKRAACVKEKYDQEIAVDDTHINGALTLGENVADIGGVKLALAALHASSKADQKPAVYRYSEDQQFFLGFAQLWCAKRRPEYMRKLAVIDPHSPPAQRVDVPLKNLSAFQDAFQCKPDSKMVAPAPRCEVW